MIINEINDIILEMDHDLRNDLRPVSQVKLRQNYFDKAYGIYKRSSVSNPELVKDSNDNFIESLNVNVTKFISDSYWKVLNSEILHPNSNFRFLRRNCDLTKEFINSFSIVERKVDSENYVEFSDIRVRQYWIESNFFFFRSERVFYSSFKVRFYLNLKYEDQVGCLSLLKGIIDGLNFLYIPFELKTAKNKKAKLQRDNTVLWVGREHYYQTYSFLAKIQRLHSGAFRNERFILVRNTQLPGVGFAEEPLDFPSFGIKSANIVGDIYFDWVDQERPNLRALIEKKLKIYGGVDYEGRFFKMRFTDYPYYLRTYERQLRRNQIYTSNSLEYNLVRRISLYLVNKAFYIKNDKYGHSLKVFWIRNSNGMGKSDKGVSLIGEGFEEGNLGIAYFLALAYAINTDCEILAYCASSIIENNTEIPEKYIKVLNQALYEDDDQNASIQNHIKESEHFFDPKEASSYSSIIDLELEGSFEYNLTCNGLYPYLRGGLAGIGMYFLKQLFI